MQNLIKSEGLVVFYYKNNIEILGFDINELANFLNDPDTNTYHL